MNQSHACLECGSFEGTVDQTCPSCGAPPAIAWAQRQEQARPVTKTPSNHASSLAGAPRKRKTPPHIWLYRRIGQIVCFATGPLFLAFSTTAYNNALECGLAGGAFLETGLVRSRQMMDRHCLSNSTGSSKPL